MNWRVIGAAVAGGLVTSLLMYGWARWSARRDRSDVSMAVLARRYRSWEVAGVALVALAMALSWLALVALSRRYPSADAALAFRLTPHPLYWLILAFFVGNLAATGPTHLLYLWLMGRARFDEFRSYQTRKFGFDGLRWLVPYYLVFGIACGALVVLLLDWYVLFSPAGIVIDPFQSLPERRYSYSQVLEIRRSAKVEAADGTIEDRPALVIHFDDDQRWSSARDPSHANAARLGALAEYVSQQSGLPIVEVGALQQTEL